MGFHLHMVPISTRTHPKNAIFYPKDATQTSVEGVHKVPISIRTYGVLGPSEENVLHTNNADPRVQDNPSFSTQMVPISKKNHILSRFKWKMNGFTCDKCMSSTQR